MPFITEEIWHAMYDGKPPKQSIALARYPEADANLIDDAAEDHMRDLQDFIENVRACRADLKVEPKIKVPIRAYAGRHVRELISENRSMVERLANVDGIKFEDGPLFSAFALDTQGKGLDQGAWLGSGSRSTPKFEVAIVYEQKIDVAAERERLTKDLKKLEGELANGQRQLGNDQFLAKAPAAVVEGLRRRKAEVESLIEKIRSALDKLV